ncbi:SDR family oxidoreductase [Pseudonocardiaceae bacterium YIM PH 21723]|nr:SDR family oxidoreductase [Pseudonocardiaceae bacterium YIM PH 21723]
MTLLTGKNAIVYGGGGAIGGAVARAFAAAGATVHLAGRTAEPLNRVAEQITGAGGQATTTQLDATVAEQVDAHAERVAGGHGSLDISINLIGVNDVQGTPLVEMDLEDFQAPIRTALRSTFLTTQAAARRMIKQGSGVILTFGGSGAPVRDYYIGGFQVALHAVDFLRRQLASELGRHGIRVVGLTTGGVPETIPADMAGREEITRALDGSTLLGRSASLADVGTIAVFAASDTGRVFTGTSLNISLGAIID